MSISCLLQLRCLDPCTLLGIVPEDLIVIRTSTARATYKIFYIIEDNFTIHYTLMHSPER